MLVSEIMTAPVVTAALDAPAAEVAALLGRHRVSAVAVVDPVGALVGLVSEHDLLAGAEATVAEV
ncbi:MAG: CBS domain-containing protein, partial [Acidimicrobiales bacterium]